MNQNCSTITEVQNFNMVADNDEVGNISDDLVVTKYKMAAEITNSKYKLKTILDHG